jgi:carbamoyl-phosphate synthase large subunit
MLKERGYNLFATPGTAAFLQENNIGSTILHWPDEDAKPNILDYLREKKIDLVINIPKNLSRTELANDYTIRRSAVDFNIPLITNARLASAYLYAICRFEPEDLAIKSWDEY